MISRRIGAAAAVTAMLLVSACGGGDDAGDSANATTKVSVTTFGCEIWNTWAISKGVYAKHRLDVELVRSGGGSAAVAAVLSGAADFGYVNGYTAINAYNTGFPIQMVSGANVNALPPAKPAQGVFVGKDSPIKSPADLAGKKIAVNEINGINQIVTASWLKANGVEPDSVSFVALPFAEQIPAVLSGRVDAAQLGYSLLGNNNDGVRSLADPFASSNKVYIATYVAAKNFVAKGDAAKRFHEAMTETAQQLNDPANKDESFRLLSECQKVPAETLAAQPQNAIEAAVDLGALDRMAQQMVDLKMMQKKPDLEPFVTDFARS
ncbi:ABC transporter substrate-binding protein [Micromonospora carbonacea]|uniref:ABC transporter substrate-binding protein n=1 Tax=Micromonospora carbonacea TaxID=47853 RepID=A0A7H8XRI9_9ACTN|nr:ABC transporter substrate-binding protein [Micromonospora carbonacea]MBB5824717.1 NitT/TauT family transport system substrate-binding protein [Micromonospora carbonacea]QLD27118.1 ABC transporter substrate-binding protein [Micromonospora carbonacea]